MKTRHKLGEAIDRLYSLGLASTETYTQLILDCVRANDVVQAQRLQTHMDTHLFKPTTTFLHNKLLHLYAKSGKLPQARNLFDKMPHRDVFSWNAILSAYAKLGDNEMLSETFERMPVRDSVSFNTVIAGFSANGWACKAIEVFARMGRDGVKVTEYGYVSVLYGCAVLRDLRRGREVHGRMVVEGSLGRNVFVWNALTDMYAKCGEVELARCLFDRNSGRNLVSWNLMISGYVRNGEFERGIRLFEEMKRLGLQSDQVTVANVLGGFFQKGDVDGARRAFREVKGKDKVCWTAMIVGCVQKGREDDALELFRDMLRENVGPDSFTISSVVSCCAKLASLCNGQLLHGRAILMGIDGDLLVSSAIVDMYCKCGVTADAGVVFRMMPARNVVSWNALIGGYAQNGLSVEALASYEDMLRQNFKPDSVTFVGILSACLHAGLMEQGEEYFNSIRKTHGMTPTVDHYACMVNLLGRYGHIDKAVQLIKGMPHEPNSIIWSTLLNICAKKGDIINGEIAARHLFHLDPNNAGPYIMLSNMYASQGRWQDVASIRSLMKTKNVKKFAAYSWIEVDHEVHKFVSEDRSHPEAAMIYKKLNALIRRLQEAGFIPNTELVLHDVGEDEKFDSICYHSEKLALAFGLIKKPHGEMPIRILKNIRICVDCHVFMKYVSKLIGRPIILRDSNRFHHFVGGNCSCKDNW